MKERLIEAEAFKKYCRRGFKDTEREYRSGTLRAFAKQITEDFCKDIDEQPTANTPEGSGILKMVSLDNVKRCADKCIDWGWTLQDFRKNMDEWDEDTVDITETE